MTRAIDAACRRPGLWTILGVSGLLVLGLRASGFPGILEAAEPTPAGWRVCDDPTLSDPREARVRRRATEALARGLTKASRRLGPLDDRVAVRWTLDFAKPSPVAREPSAPAWGPQDLGAGRTRWSEDGALEVVIFGRRFLWAPEEILTVVDHEIAHAYLATRLGSQARYGAVAPWFREGLAVWFSGEGPRALDAAVALGAFSEGRADRCLRGLPASGSHEEPATRADAYVAVAWLESRTGEEGVRTLVRAVAGGRRLDDALWDLVGLPPEAFGATVLRWGRDLVAQRLPPQREARFVDSLRLRGTARESEAADRWRALLGEDPEGPLGGTLMYLLARSELGEGAGLTEADRAEAHVRVLLESSGTLWRAEGLVLLGELRALQGRAAEAREAWRTVLDAYWDEAGPAGRARRRLETSAGGPTPEG